MQDLVRFVQEHKAFFDAMGAAGSVISLLGWFITFVLLLVAWRRGGISRVTAFGVDVTLAQEAVVATTRATRARRTGDAVPGGFDLSRIKNIVARAFQPEVASRLTGKAVLWVDDGPDNNHYEATALRKMGLVIDQVTSTEAALAELGRQSFDLVISDMARGPDAQAGYGLLAAIRNGGNRVPFLLYTSSNAPEHRKEAQAKGAQGSTNDPGELIAMAIDILNK